MNRRQTDQLRGIRQYDVCFTDPLLPLAGLSHCNVCVVEPDVADVDTILRHFADVLP